MNCIIRQMTAADRAVWANLRAALWPEETAEQHAAEIDRIGDHYWAFVAEIEGNPAGFAELSIRRYANGCEFQPVPFLEGIWVAPVFRRQRIGAQLLHHIEAFALARGFREIGSDALIDNTTSHAAHRAWGFSETERVVYFRKSLSVK